MPNITRGVVVPIAAHRGVDVAGYLARLDVPHPGPPSAEALRILHRAHVERVPYDTVGIHLGRTTTVDPFESADRIVRLGRAGYCLQLNGAFAALLTALGYQVIWHRGGVQVNPDRPAPGADGAHLALTVHGLPEPGNPNGTWFVDVGMGDGLHEPLPLVVGSYRQGPFTYRLMPSPVELCGWRFEHDPAGSFAAMDFSIEPAMPADFAARHIEMSTSPDSNFVRVFAAFRRHATGVERLRGCVLSRVGADAGTWELTEADDWYAALADRFGLTLADATGSERSALWDRMLVSHDAWLARARQEADVVRLPIARRHRQPIAA